MKTIILGILVTLSLTINAHAIIDTDLATALKSGNSAAVAKYFDVSVDLTIPGSEGVFSKAQAELILKKFFSTNKPSAFDVIHSGDSKNDSHYSIGNLKTGNGIYRTFILYKESGGAITILELRIEPAE